MNSILMRVLGGVVAAAGVIIGYIVGRHYPTVVPTRLTVEVNWSLFALFAGPAFVAGVVLFVGGELVDALNRRPLPPPPSAR